jgi:replicative DNA helicase Mcm
MIQEVVDKFKTIYGNLYESQINSLKREKYGGTLEVSYEDIRSENETLAEDIMNTPAEILDSAEKAAKQVTDSERVQVLINDYNGIELGISDLRDSHLGKLVKINGIVSQRTSIVPKADVATFKCTNGHYTDVKQGLKTELEYPLRCSGEDCSVNRNGRFELITPQTTKINFQKLEIQEPHDEVTGGETPQTISLNVRGGLAGRVSAGDSVTVTGIYTATAQSNSSVFNTFIEGVNVQAEQKEFEEVEITDEDLEKIQQYASDDDIYKKLINSIAPTIRGLESEKEAVAYQLFRGIRKSKMDTNIRGDIHILLVGDPSVGKSQVLRYASEVSPRAVMTSGKGSSEAGLTVSAVRDSDMGGEEEWRLKAGAMVMADEGLACIDEMDKMDSSDRTAMFEGLEQQTISVAKAGINATLKSRCALLGAANPKDGRWNKYDSIPAQIDLEAPLVSRFDLIFAPKDKQDKEQDKKLATHILKANKYGQQLEAGVSETIESASIEPTIPPDILRKYIAYARSNCQPVLTDEAKDTLRDFFVDIRNEQTERDSIPITARKIEGLVRISEAAARIQLSDEVTTQHAKRAIQIVKQSLRDVGYDEEADSLDIDKIEAGQTTTQRNRKRALFDVIDKQKDNGDKGAPIKKVLADMEKNGFDRKKIEELIRKHTTKDEGKLYKPKNNEILLL